MRPNYRLFLKRFPLVEFNSLPFTIREIQNPVFFEEHGFGTLIKNCIEYINFMYNSVHFSFRAVLMFSFISHPHNLYFPFLFQRLSLEEIALSDKSARCSYVTLYVY